LVISTCDNVNNIDVIATQNLLIVSHHLGDSESFGFILGEISMEVTYHHDVTQWRSHKSR